MKLNLELEGIPVCGADGCYLKMDEGSFNMSEILAIYQGSRIKIVINVEMIK